MSNKTASPIHRSGLAGLILLTATVAPMAAHAATDPLIEGAKLCTQHFPGEEQKNNIPTHLLAAIATTESGRWHKGLGMNVPWPWTVNVNGKGYYFDSKAEAIAQVQRFQAQGQVSIDVGCMQVNLKHHAKAFANLSEAFNPSNNVGYAAKFLRNNYTDLGDWIKATAAYHSRTPVHGQRYLGEIEKSWNRIVTKVAAARAQEALGGKAVASNPSVLMPEQTPAQPIVTAAVKKRPMRPLATSRGVRDIKVVDATAPRRKAEILVVRPQAARKPAATLAVADATPRAASIVGSSIRRVSLDN